MPEAQKKAIGKGNPYGRSKHKGMTLQESAMALPLAHLLEHGKIFDILEHDGFGARTGPRYSCLKCAIYGSRAVTCLNNE